MCIVERKSPKTPREGLERHVDGSIANEGFKNYSMDGITARADDDALNVTVGMETETQNCGY
eukprot:scaffold1909_cov130-Cylindrotheca_fusiformis.AAC.16